MKKLTYPMLVIALALTLIAPPLSAFAQQDRAGLTPAPLRSQNEEPARSPRPSNKPHAFYYYRPGELTGTPYQTMQECSQATQQAGNVGVCVMK